MTKFFSYELAERVSIETGLGFNGSEGRTSDGIRWFELTPAGHPPGQTFAIRVEIGWRRIDLRFRLGNFAGELMSAIRSVDESGRHIFISVLDSFDALGADVALQINGVSRSHGDHSIWDESWRSFGFLVGKGMLALNEGDNVADMRIIEELLAAARKRVIMAVSTRFLAFPLTS